MVVDLSGTSLIYPAPNFWPLGGPPGPHAAADCVSEGRFTWSKVCNFCKPCHVHNDVFVYKYNFWTFQSFTNHHDISRISSVKIESAQVMRLT